MLGSTIPVSIIGIRFAMSVEPFWRPEQYSASQRMIYHHERHTVYSSCRWNALRCHHIRNRCSRELRLEGNIVRSIPDSS